ncbi:MAG: MATE family efflux transporter [Micropruina sp.]
MSDQTEERSATQAPPSVWREVVALAVPVTAQAVIMSLLMLTDQLLVGQLGDVAIAAVGIVSKITAILTVALTGLATATSIFCSQFLGGGQRDQVHRVFGVALRFGIALTIVMVAVCILWPQVLVWPFTSDPALIAAASSFLRIVAVGYLPTMATLLYAALLRSDKVVKLAMYAGVVAVVLNLVLDYLLIFGMFGAPRWGLEGAGVATTVARYVEFAVILVVSYRTGNVAAIRRWSDLKSTDPGIRKRFLIVALPLALNEFLWILGESTYAGVYGRMGTHALAAMGMTFPLQGLSIGLMSGLSAAAAVLVGQHLGRGDVAHATSLARKLLLLSMGASGALGLLIAIGAPWYAALYALSPDTGQMAIVCLLVFSGFLFVKVANMVLGSVLNSGGDSRFILVMESSATWFVGVPLAIIAAFVLRLPIGWVYFLLSIEEVLRLVVGYVRFRTGRWARNLAVPADEADPVLNPV